MEQQNLGSQTFYLTDNQAIKVSESTEWETGSGKGFFIETDLATPGVFMTGIITREEARRMALFILERTKE